MAKKDRSSLLAAPLLFVLAACSGTSSPLGSTTASTSDAGSGSDGAGRDGGSSATTTGAGGNYIIVLRATQSPVAVDGSTSGQTPSDQRIGFLGLRLLQDASSEGPLDVADFSTPVDVGYNDGDETVIAKVPAKSLRAGHFTTAEVPIAYVRFTVAGTYHDGDVAAPGNFADVIAMANGTAIDGTTHDQGYWKTTFSSAAGTTLGTMAGENAVVAQPSPASAIALDTSGSPAKYVFPTDLVIDPNLDHDEKIVFTVNTYEDFRWQDSANAGFTAGVFDVSNAGFETVTQLGANSIETSIE